MFNIRPQCAHSLPVIARSACDEAIQLSLPRMKKLDCFAEPVNGRAFARSVGSQ
jgi:hypothetical protein